MFGIVKRIKHEVRDKTIYMEIFGENKVTYRVLSGRMCIYGDEIITYGIEVIDHKNGEKELIADFSRNIEDAVAFAAIFTIPFLKDSLSREDTVIPQKGRNILYAQSI